MKFAGCIEKHEHTSSFPSCLIKMWTNSFFFLYNLSPESKGGLNYFFLFSPYRERVGFITLIYFTFLSSPRQQTVSSASSRGCMFHARVISDLRSGGTVKGQWRYRLGRGYLSLVKTPWTSKTNSKKLFTSKTNVQRQTDLEALNYPLLSTTCRYTNIK